MHMVSSMTLRHQPSEETLCHCLEAMVEASGLTAISPPMVLPCGCGIEVFILIAESHIAITIHPPFCYVSMFSCKEFDMEEMEQILRDHLVGEGMVTDVLPRTAGVM